MADEKQCVGPNVVFKNFQDGKGVRTICNRTINEPFGEVNCPYLSEGYQRITIDDDAKGSEFGQLLKYVGTCGYLSIKK